MRAPVSAGQTRPLAWRIEQLQRLDRLLETAAPRMVEALASDLGRPEVEASFELAALRQELRHTRRHLAGWMRPRRRSLPLWAWPGQGAVRAEPLGCVLIIGAWNYPFDLCLHPLVHALAAGNTAVLKPSEQSPAAAALLAELLASHFPPEVVQVICGDGAVASRLLEQERFDHILYTGGERVGRLVMAAAARHLTPVTLELGGQNPAIVLDGADPAITARRLLWGRSLNAGQTCLAPNHVLVLPGVRDALMAAFHGQRHALYGQDPLASPDLGQIVGAGRFERLEGLLAQARDRGQVLLGGRSDAANRKIEPTLVAVDEPHSDPLMQEELFAPILPLLSVGSLEEALTLVRRNPKPLALYLFGGGAAERERVLAGTSSGSVVVNDVVVQGGVASLPFGGIGPSGMGTYHGEAGFLTFSHQRSVLSRPLWPDPPVRYPPYAGKLGLIRRLMG
ncbi:MULTISPECIES: aldehyde dehydrogenase family protein [unclassified Cyanobium]|uniref:aldehyde dehydrogenase family protein n=1 Tax=unclassified Cyanobium TaxID=2627006 RepID=UPI0020CBB1C5|nr:MULTISPECIES: aldehyde dehydrogenase family protein [unclassified Cyanobium]MCP9860442.1 aldehyde dehydrogenase family protein [Cyanobium sp. Cruz-8H5]MCP9867503.1 aldehyde dehydrogenase family protein [Cyanobium sp. Cruz-8D1]